MPRLEVTRTDKVTHARIRIGSTLCGFSHGELVEKAVASYLKELGVWRTVERVRKDLDK